MKTFGNEPLHAYESAEPFASLTGLSTPRGECENHANQWTVWVDPNYKKSKPHIYKHWFGGLWTAKEGTRLGLGRTPSEAYSLLKGAE
jgi:hypothetical protein